MKIGHLEDCEGSSCAASCCRDGYTERGPLFENSPLGDFKDQLEGRGIKFQELSTGNYHIRDCSDDGICLIEQFSHLDIRSLICKVHPYIISDIGYIQGHYNKIFLTHNIRCPISDSLPQEFTELATELVRDEYERIYKRKTKVIDIT